MRRKLALSFAVVLLAGACLTNWLWANERVARRWIGRSVTSAPTAWHTGYYEPAWGLPTPLVVPPKAEMETHYGWGVGNTRVTPLHHQFQPGYPGPLFYDARTLRPAPAQPTDTDQMGVYSIRGPW